MEGVAIRGLPADVPTVWDLRLDQRYLPSETWSGLALAVRIARPARRVSLARMRTVLTPAVASWRAIRRMRYNVMYVATNELWTRMGETGGWFDAHVRFRADPNAGQGTARPGEESRSHSDRTGKAARRRRGAFADARTGAHATHS